MEAKQYQTPAVEEHGPVEHLTLQSDKCSPGSDDIQNAPQVTGSIQSCIDPDA